MQLSYVEQRLHSSAALSLDYFQDRIGRWLHGDLTLHRQTMATSAEQSIVTN